MKTSTTIQRTSEILPWVRTQAPHRKTAKNKRESKKLLKASREKKETSTEKQS